MSAGHASAVRTREVQEIEIQANGVPALAAGNIVEIAPAPRRKISIFVFIDALGWEVYRKHGFLADLLTHTRRLRTTFGFSSAADPSILTGRYPEEHGHWSAFFHSPATSPFRFARLLAALPRAIFDRWRVRLWLSRIVGWWKGYTGYFQLYSVPFSVLPHFDYLEKRDYFVPGGILNGDTIFDWLKERGLPWHCSNWRRPEPENVAAARAAVASGEPRLVYLYLPRLDGIMHTVGTAHADVSAHLRWYEEQIRALHALAQEHYDEVTLHVLSDHGMCDVSGSVDLIARIEKLGLKFGRDYVAMYDSTMARFWFPNPEARARVTRALEDSPEGRIVTDDELAAFRCRFPGAKFGELFWLCNPGILINPSYMGLKVIPGMHGYHPDHDSSWSFLGSTKPLPDHVRSITDLRSIMEAEVLAGL